MESTTSPKPFVFVLMPFTSTFDDLYKLAIREAVNQAGGYCERVDEQHFDGSITQRIYNQIGKADVIVAVMTGKNPNVFYETGYAHALNKRTILITNDAKEIPFDLSDHAHIVYGDSLTSLRDSLRARLQWAIQNPSRQLTTPGSFLTLRINGGDVAPNVVVRVRNSQRVESEDDPSPRNVCALDIAAHVPPDRIAPNEVKIGIACERELDWDCRDGIKTVVPSAEQFIHIREAPFALTPGAWDSVPFVLQNWRRTESFRATLIVFDLGGTREIPFTVVPE